MRSLADVSEALNELPLLANVHTPRLMSAIFPIRDRDAVEEAGRVGSVQSVSFATPPPEPMHLIVRTRTPSVSGGEYGPATQLNPVAGRADCTLGSFGLSSGLHATAGSANSAGMCSCNAPPSHRSDRDDSTPHVLLLAPVPHDMVTSQSAGQPLELTRQLVTIAIALRRTRTSTQ
jgi:hypothetical protein